MKTEIRTPRDIIVAKLEGNQIDLQAIEENRRALHKELAEHDKQILAETKPKLAVKRGDYGIKGSLKFVVTDVAGVDVTFQWFGSSGGSWSNVWDNFDSDKQAVEFDVIGNMDDIEALQEEVTEFRMDCVDFESNGIEVEFNEGKACKNFCITLHEGGNEYSVAVNIEEFSLKIRQMEAEQKRRSK